MQAKERAAAADSPSSHAWRGWLLFFHRADIVDDGLGIGLDGGADAGGKRERDRAVARARRKLIEASGEADAAVARARLDLPLKAADAYASVAGRRIEMAAPVLHVDGPIDVQNGRGHLNATTGDGRIRISGFEGQVETRTGDGSISLAGRFNQLSARTGDGSISLSLPSGVRATIETDAESVINDVGAVEEQQPASQRVRRWRIGGGGPLFRLHTGDGRIILRTSDSLP